MTAPLLHQPCHAVQKAEHQHDRDDVPGDRSEIDVEVPPRIVALHFFGIVGATAEARQ